LLFLSFLTGGVNPLEPSRFERLLYKQTGKAIRPTPVENAYRTDGWVNLINRFNTSKDDTANYFFTPEPEVDDTLLEMFYENNGLFAKIIDTPAEEAVKHGFELEDISDDKITDFYKAALHELDWEETAMLGIKWARLFGGALGVLLVNDGRGLEEPLDWDNIKSIDDIRVYDRSAGHLTRLLHSQPSCLKLILIVQGKVYGIFFICQ
jgi:hypothetical protein